MRRRRAAPVKVGVAIVPALGHSSVCANRTPLYVVYPLLALLSLVAVKRAAAKAAVLPRKTDEFLETLTLAAIAMGGDDQANGIAFTLAAFEMAGKEAPDFGWCSDRD